MPDRDDLEARFGGLLPRVDDHDFGDPEAVLDVLIVSEDRAFRLDALLRNLRTFLHVRFRVHIHYSTSTADFERGYDALRLWYRGLNWVVATAARRRSLADMVAAIAAGPGRFLLPLADDAAFVRPYDDEGLLLSLDDDRQLLAVSLKTHDPLVSDSSQPETPLRWEWADCKGSWGQPMSLGGHVYRTSELAAHLPRLDFTDMTGIEASMSKRPLSRPALLRPKQACVVRYSLVGGGTATDHGLSGAEELAINQAFLAGFAQDVRPLVELAPTSSHVDTQLSLMPDLRSRRSPKIDVVGDPWQPQRVPNTEGSDRSRQLDEHGQAILEMCDGNHTREAMLETLQHNFQAPRKRLERILRTTLEDLVDREWIEGARQGDPSEDLLRLDLRKIPTFVINCEEDSDKRGIIEGHLRDLGFDFEIVRGLTADPAWHGIALSHLKVLRLSRAQVPFLVLEDDCQFLESFDPVLEIPTEAHAISLGLSIFGLEVPGRFSWGKQGKVRSMPYTKSWLRVLNMLARHAVLYLSADYQEAIIESQVEALTNREFPHMGDIGCAMQHASHLVLAPNEPVCRQRARDSTATSLRATKVSTTPSDEKALPDRKVAESSESNSRKPSARPTDPEVIASCLRDFQRVNEERSECVVYHLGDRGFFAELTTVARGMIWAWIHGYRFLLDSTSFAYSIERGWEDYFEPFCGSPDDVAPETIREHFEFKLSGDKSAFQKLRAYMPERLDIDGLTIGGFQEILGLFTAMIFRPNRDVRKQIAELADSIAPGEDYVALHVRRGDKVGDEDVYYPSSLYLNQVAPLSEVQGIYVMSDDFQAVKEVRQELARRGFEIPVTTLTDPSQSGFDIWKLRSGESFMAHGAEQDPESSDRDYKFDETVRVLADVTLASKARTFVSTFRSNVGRTVSFLHAQPKQCILLSEAQLASPGPAPEGESIAISPEKPAPRSAPASDVEIHLEGGHRHHVHLPAGSTALGSLLDLQNRDAQRDDHPLLVQLPLDAGRSSLTFSPKHLLGLSIKTHEQADFGSVSASRAVKTAIPQPSPKPAPKQGQHPLMNQDEGHLGGYMRSNPSDTKYAHGDPWTWAPDLWRWTVQKFDIGSVLDVGCGEGHAARFFRELGCEVLAIDGSQQARESSVVPEHHLVHDYQDGPYLPEEPFDMVWSCEFVEHVEERFTQNLLATFASARKVVLMTFAGPNQPGWHHVNTQPEKYWIDKVQCLGFSFDAKLTEEARRYAGDATHVRRACLVFVRISELGVLPARADEPIRPDLRPEARPALTINDMQVVGDRGQDFYLFLDIFVHPSRTKIVAVAPFYDQDWSPSDHGIDFEKVDLVLEDRRIRGHYLPHRLDSWEPCILFEFSDPALSAQLVGSDKLSFSIEAGPHSKSFDLSTRAEPAHDVAMSLVVKNENHWIRHFLEYYLSCMGVSHVWVYDNGTADRDELLSILRPYQDRRQVTYIPWAYRWRNKKPAKMIGQPPQEAHSLNRFANSRWIGFLDVDELLRIPGRTLPEYLSMFERAEVDGLSFGLRWFVYKGPLGFEQVYDPPLTYRHAHRDDLGRKRQKFFVRPGDVRFMRLHQIEDGKRELQVDDSEIFFHHYVQRAYRFEDAKTQETERDDYMLRFSDRLRLHQRLRAPATTHEWITHIESAWAAAEAEATALPPEVLDIRGMCGVKTRHFYNALCAFDGCRYLEIGSWFGASSCAAIAGNQVDAIFIDNWTQFGGHRAGFESHLEPWRGSNSVKIIEADCFEVETSDLGPVDIFLYDGDHSRESHSRAIQHYSGTFAEWAVVIVDDWNWERVRLGTQDAFDALGLQILYKKELILPPEDVEDMPRHAGRLTWWNGIAVFLVAGKP